jgi:hypothetical protein
MEKAMSIWKENDVGFFVVEKLTTITLFRSIIVFCGTHNIPRNNVNLT